MCKPIPLNEIPQGFTTFSSLTSKITIFLLCLDIIFFFKLQESFDHLIYEGNSVRKLLKKGASTNIQYHNFYENKIRTIIEQNKLTSLWWLFLCIMRVSLGPFHSVSGHLHCLHPRQTHKPKSHLYCNFFNKVNVS